MLALDSISTNAATRVPLAYHAELQRRTLFQYIPPFLSCRSENSIIL